MRRLLPSLLVLVLCHRPLSAQAGWTLTVERGSTTFSASAHDTSSPPVRLVPWHPTLYSVRLTRMGERVGVGLTVSHGKGDFGAQAGDVVVLPGLTLAVTEFAPEVAVRIATTPLGAVLRLQAGPVLDLWSPSGADMRTTYGASAGASLAMPLSSRWAVSLRGDLTLTTGETTKDETSDQIIRESTLRRGHLGLGVTRRL